MPLFNFFSKKRDKTTPTNDLSSSLEDALPRHHSSSSAGRKTYGSKDLPSFYQSTKGRKYAKGPKSCPIDVSDQLGSPITSRRPPSIPVPRCSVSQSESDDEQEVRMTTMDRIREKLRQTEEDKLNIYRKYEDLKLRRREERNRTRDDLLQIDKLRRENADLQRKNEELERELEWRKAQDMQRYHAHHNPSHNTYVDARQYEQMQNEIRELHERLNRFNPMPTLGAFPNTFPTTFLTPANSESRSALNTSLLLNVDGSQRPSSDTFVRQFSSASSGNEEI